MYFVKIVYGRSKTKKATLCVTFSVLAPLLDLNPTPAYPLIKSLLSWKIQKSHSSLVVHLQGFEPRVSIPSD